MNLLPWIRIPSGLFTGHLLNPIILQAICNKVAGPGSIRLHEQHTWALFGRYRTASRFLNDATENSYKVIGQEISNCPIPNSTQLNVQLESLVWVKKTTLPKIRLKYAKCRIG